MPDSDAPTSTYHLPRHPADSNWQQREQRRLKILEQFQGTPGHQAFLDVIEALYRRYRDHAILAKSDAETCSYKHMAAAIAELLKLLDVEVNTLATAAAEERDAALAQENGTRLHELRSAGRRVGMSFDGLSGNPGEEDFSQPHLQSPY